MLEIAELIKYGIPKTILETSVPIKKVTITEDQADIYREAPIEWDKGPLNILIKNTTPYMVDRTLWAEIFTEEKEKKPEIGSVRCVRWFVPLNKNGKEKENKIVEELEKLYCKIEALIHRSGQITRLNHGLNNSLTPTMKSIMEQVVFSGAMPDTYSSLMDTLLNSMKDLSEEEYKLQKEGKEYYNDLKKLYEDYRVNISDSKILNKEGGIIITLDGKFSHKGLIRCGYQVPCAQWRPQHEAHLLEDEKVLLITQGIVWQNTGENWNDAELTLSTAKPSLGLDIVLPGEDILQLREKTKEEKKHIKVEIRDEIIQSTGEGNRNTDEPPLPSDGGETQFYRIKNKVNILSNGRPHIINLEETELEGQTAFTAIPEFNSNVFLISQVKNTGGKPILAGPVMLHRKDLFIGTGQFELAGSNEAFHIWWGSEDFIRINRYEDVKKEEATIFQNKKITYTIKLHIRNLSGEETDFRIHERIPVSELEQVKITVKKLPDRASLPDNNGFTFIPVTIGPREEKTLEISYLMEIAKEVVYDV